MWYLCVECVGCYFDGWMWWINDFMCVVYCEWDVGDFIVFDVYVMNVIIGLEYY